MKSAKKMMFLFAGIVILLYMKTPANAYGNDVLGADVTNYIDSRSGTVSVGVYDASTGQTYTYNASKTYYTMSIVKTSMLANVLHKQIPITQQQNSLLTKMIVNSDNGAANTIWWQLGSERNVQAFFNKAGMSSTKAGTGGWWGRTTTTVSDQLTLMRHFAYPNTLLTDTQREYGLNLMRNVHSSQRWGTSYGIPSGVSVALKNGWITTGQHVNSVGYINGQGKNYIIAVLTTNNKSFSYGIDTINRISSMVWNNIPRNGWVKLNGKWYFYIKNIKHTGWLKQNSQWYYLDSNGAMKTGWIKFNGSWYYLNDNGEMKTGWQKINGTWYFFDNSGLMKTGWVKSSSKWYFLQTDGKMTTGWHHTDGKWYYFRSGGDMRTGWTLYEDRWYFLNSSGEMQTSWLELSGKKYYFMDNGMMATGWKQIDSKWYYFYDDGTMAAHTAINGYEMGKDGAWIQVTYVSMGASLAAGMNPQGQDRTPENGVDPDWGYPNYIAEHFAKSYQLQKFINFGVSGYTTDNVISDLEKEAVQQEVKKATHLTLDIGANEWLSLLDSEQDQAISDIPVITGKINTILEMIDELNPNVKVYVMGYYNPYPYMTDPQQKEQVNQLLSVFNAQIEEMANQHGDTFVPTADVINVTNYADYLPNPENIHLSLLGYRAVAEEFWKAMQ